MIFLAFNTLYSFTNTLNRLDVVESERDRWQRPLDVLRALDLQKEYAGRRPWLRSRLLRAQALSRRG